MAKELTVVERAAQALAPAASETALRELTEKYRDVKAVKNSTDAKMVRPAIAELRTARVAITKIGKEARDDANAFARAVIAEERRLIGIIEPEERRLKDLVDTYEAEQERIKEEARQREVARAQAIRGRINDFATLAVSVAHGSVNKIEEAQQKLAGVQIDESFAEFRAEAQLALDDTRKRLESAHAAAVEREAEAARLEAERQRLEAQRQAEEQYRQEEARRLAAERARMEAERRELEAVRREIERQQEEAAAAERARVEREQAAERARVDAEQAEAARVEEERVTKDAAKKKRRPGLAEALCRAAAIHHDADPEQWRQFAETVTGILADYNVNLEG